METKHLHKVEMMAKKRRLGMFLIPYKVNFQVSSCTQRASNQSHRFSCLHHPDHRRLNCWSPTTKVQALLFLRRFACSRTPFRHYHRNIHTFARLYV